jgi:hypothetical protein
MGRREARRRKLLTERNATHKTDLNSVCCVENKGVTGDLAVESRMAKDRYGGWMQK